jgi:hypothetical protein
MREGLLDKIESMSDTLDGTLDFVDPGMLPGKMPGFLRRISTVLTVVLRKERYTGYLSSLAAIRRLTMEKK